MRQRTPKSQSDRASNFENAASVHQARWRAFVHVMEYWPRRISRTSGLALCRQRCAKQRRLLFNFAFRGWQAFDTP
eukprot:SAG31_NODE_18998_length_615_cov_0.994186_1_plen_75_part_10